MGLTALMLAAFFGRTEAAAALLKGGADPTAKAGPGPVEGKTALEIDQISAMQEGNEAVAALTALLRQAAGGGDVVAMKSS